MRIALLGTRGIPARYGGYETFAEELSVRLSERGHNVTVYCRQQHSRQSYRGVSLTALPTIRHKYLDTLAHSAISTLHLLLHRHDVVLYCNAANALFTILPRALGMPVALNVDGIERHRKKWNRAARAWYMLSEFLATRFPTVMVTDARQIAAYYQKQYGKASSCIPYGAPIHRFTTATALEQLGVAPHQYWLYVTRFEPENNPLLVRQAFEQADSKFHLVLVGDAPYARDYIDAVRATNNPRIHIPGAIYGDGYHELQSHCFGYIQATEVGGTHPALIEAMGKGNLVLYLNTPENAEVAGDAALAFERDGLPNAIAHAESLSPEEWERFRSLSQDRIRRLYSWDAITILYERLFQELQARGNPLSVQWNPH